MRFSVLLPGFLPELVCKAIHEAVWRAIRKAARYRFRFCLWGTLRMLSMLRMSVLQPALQRVASSRSAVKKTADAWNLLSSLHIRSCPESTRCCAGQIRISHLSCRVKKLWCAGFVRIRMYTFESLSSRIRSQTSWTRSPNGNTSQ